jgi:hypothetical protein
MRTVLTESEYIVLWSLWGRGRTDASWVASSLRTIISKEDYEAAICDLVSAQILRHLPNDNYLMTEKARRAMSRNEFTRELQWDGGTHGEWNV